MTTDRRCTDRQRTDGLLSYQLTWNLWLRGAKNERSVVRNSIYPPPSTLQQPWLAKHPQLQMQGRKLSGLAPHKHHLSCYDIRNTRLLQTSVWDIHLRMQMWMGSKILLRIFQREYQRIYEDLMWSVYYTLICIIRPEMKP